MKGSSKTSIRRDNADFNYAVQVTRLILRAIGAWPIPSYASNVERLATRLQNVICYFLFAFIIVPGLLRVFLKEHEFKRRVRLLAPLLNCWMGCLKYFLLISHAREIQSCLDQARQDWNNTVKETDRQAMLSTARVGRKFAIFSAVFMYVGGLSYRTLVPLSKGKMLTPMNVTVRALACPSYFIKFDGQVSPAYEIVFTLQFFAGLITYSVRVGAAGLAAFFIMHVCGQLRIIMGKLQCLNDMPNPNDRAVAMLLADIVRHQIKVKGFLVQVEETMRYVWLVEIMGSSILLCLSGYYIIMEWQNNDSTAMLTMSVMLTSFTFSIFTNCYVGQRLTDQSTKVGLMTSTTRWYRLQCKRARSLILVIAVSNIPAKISAGRMIEMSLPTFLNIVKTSMAYFNMLVHRLILGLIGVWPSLEKPGRLTRFLRGLLRTACCFMLSFNVIPWALYMFLILDTFKSRIRMFGALMFYSMVPAMYCALILREDRIRKCMKHLQEDWWNVRDAKDRRIMLDKARSGRFILICTTLFLFLSGFTYRLIQPIFRRKIVIGNVTIRPLVQGNYYVFFDPQQSPAYEIVFSMNLFTGIIIYTVTTSVCGITALFTMHACGQLEVLAAWLENLTNEDQSKDRAVARRLAAIVMHHGWERNDALSSTTYGIMLVSFTFNIFILCYIGEVLNSQGSKVNTTCCTIDWYCLPSKETRYLILVIAMARYPTKLTAGKVIDLSFNSFGAVVKTSVAYLNMLRTLTT
ncbi:PREDICTED: odorant receptor 4-like [Wasmannia auropunctata]|uniref:odorant receptor 4-like n=1 Tax=Wasmannia auropunctata TaxID=64793 RepID=UPI0005ED636A|nr:PREDICTED: odorant receptor 4-like [Wasmannia auropunctata]